MIWKYASLPLAFTCGLFLANPGAPAFAAESRLVQTNSVERWITNVVEVRVAANKFVTEYHTNWVHEFRTNVVDLFATNRIVRSRTNLVPVDVFQTNLVTAFKTNRHSVQLTNEVAVNLMRTNLVDRFRTNWQTLNFTNWQTVMVVKTNWVTQLVTNVAHVNLPAGKTTAAAAPQPTAETAANDTKADAQPAVPTDAAVIENARAPRPVANGMLEVQLHLRWTTPGLKAPQIVQWRLEREDGAVLSFGQEQQFQKDLPPGTYKVDARFRRSSDSPVLITRATLAVSARDAAVEPKPVSKRFVAQD